MEIEKKDLQLIKRILKEHVPEYKVWAFGSRVNGNAKKYSDLDLVIISKSPVSVLTIALLKEAFSESELLYKVDIVDWSLISEGFKKIINEKHEIVR